MWSVGGEVKFGKGHGQDAKRGLELGIERATAAIARGTFGSGAAVHGDERFRNLFYVLNCLTKGVWSTR